MRIPTKAKHGFGELKTAFRAELNNVRTKRQAHVGFFVKFGRRKRRDSKGRFGYKLKTLIIGKDCNRRLGILKSQHRTAVSVERTRCGIQIRQGGPATFA